jgi:uncharacterized protein with PIN domain
MTEPDISPGIDECMACPGPIRRATPLEVEKHLSEASEQYRAAVEQQEGTWYICPSCGPWTAGKWCAVEWDEVED